MKKKGVSTMIGYVILISTAIAISSLVFIWIKNFAPTESKECREGVSLIITNVSCTANELELKIKNNGRFSVGGFFIRGSTNLDATLGDIALASGHWKETESNGLNNHMIAKNTSSNAILMASGVNHFNVSRTRRDLFDLTNLNRIYFVQILPLRYEVIEGKQTIVACSKANIRKFKVQCP